MKALKLPMTEDGRNLLRFHVHMAGGWDFPGGTNAADYDWDQEAIQAEKYYRSTMNDGALS